MEVELSQVKSVGLPVRGRIRLDPEQPGPSSLPGDVAAGGVRFPEPLELDGTARRDGETFVVTGRITGHAVLACARCLAEVVRELDLAFEARFAPQSAAPRAPGARWAEHHGMRSFTDAEAAGLLESMDHEGGIHLEKDDMDTSFLPAGAQVLVVDEVVREQVLLDLPLRVLCRDDCKGLCPRCGADRNAEPCGCGADAGGSDLRLAPLAAIRKKLEEN